MVLSNQMQASVDKQKLRIPLWAEVILTGFTLYPCHVDEDLTGGVREREGEYIGGGILLSIGAIERAGPGIANEDNRKGIARGENS